MVAVEGEILFSVIPLLFELVIVNVVYTWNSTSVEKNKLTTWSKILLTKEVLK